MDTRRMKQFDLLYEQFMPRAYRAALYLTGSRKAAAAIAERAFLQTASGAAGRDARSFGTELVRLLVAETETASKRFTYNTAEIAAEVDGQVPTLAGQLSKLGFAERVLVVLYGEFRLSAGEVARVLRAPEWLVDLRLRRAISKICRVTELVLPLAVPEAGRTA